MQQTLIRFLGLSRVFVYYPTRLHDVMHLILGLGPRGEHVEQESG